MGRKTQNNEKKAQNKAKKKEIEFNFNSLRNGLSQKAKNDLIDYFTSAKSVFNQSKEELFLLNKRFDALEYTFKALFKKDTFTLNKTQIDTGSFNNRKETEKQEDKQDFVINEKYLACLFDSDKEDIKEDAKESDEEMSELITKKEKPKNLNQKKSNIKPYRKEDFEAYNDHFFDKDSDSGNNSHLENKYQLDPSKSHDFNQELFDYKSFPNSQANKESSSINNAKSKVTSSFGSWINK